MGKVEYEMHKVKMRSRYAQMTEQEREEYKKKYRLKYHLKKTLEKGS